MGGLLRGAGMNDQVRVETVLKLYQLHRELSQYFRAPKVGAITHEWCDNFGCSVIHTLLSHFSLDVILPLIFSSITKYLVKFSF